MSRKLMNKVARQPKTIAIIQARMGSTRLPGKVLMDLAGKSMLARVVDRTRRCSLLHDVVVATSTLEQDLPIVTLCKESGYPVYLGSEEDVLDRYFQTARIHEAELVVRITSDCPLIDPGITSLVVERFRSDPEVDYVCTFLPHRTFPLGLDVEAFSFEALERAWHEDQNPAWREHVTPYLHRHPELFRHSGVMSAEDASHLRWTVDTPQDYQLARRIYEHFRHDEFTWRDVLELIRQNPSWSEINRGVLQKVLP